MIPLALLPISDLVELQSLEQQEDHFLVAIKTKCTYDFCPECGQKTTNRHSCYVRKLIDLPWAGIPVKVNLQVYKYYCKNENCHRKIFAQRMGEKLKPYARRTHRLTQHLNQIGFALGGNNGARIAGFIGMPISSSTLLRIIHHFVPNQEISTPRVLGIDDWSFRKGKNYGTILVDLEKHKPIDLLPDREVETVKKWLEAHPGIEIITRDRADCYKQAATLGASNAIQVADRWHLLKNMGEALKRFLDKHNKELRMAAKDIAKSKAAEQEKLRKKTEKEAIKKKNRKKNKEEEKPPLSRYELNFLEVKRLRKKGHSIRSIHKQTGVHRQTIKKYLKYETYPLKAVTTTKTSLALPYDAYLRERWNEGQTNHKALWREIKEQGFTGSSQSVYRLVSKYPKAPGTEKQPPPLEVKVWSARKVSLLLSKPFEDQDEAVQNYLRAFYKHCPAANKASQLARKFKSITDQLKKKHLNRWIKTVLESDIYALKNFATGLLKDYDAVKAAVSLTWSNGQVEGQVNRLKNIKRQMYGRAGFELLRKRVLMDSS